MEPAGPYILVSRLGEGGMAEVFKAYKQGPDGWKKPLALKRILPQFADNQQFIQMLSAEARLHAHLEHPNIVQILDFFRHGESFVMALEYVPGKNLRSIIHDAQKDNRPLPWQACVYILTETLKGLDYAHKRRGPEGPLGIIHRDISPQNILISYDGHVKLSDFGIALASIEREHTRSGVLKGKLRYLSAEQLEQKSISFKSDLFSIGVVLYEILAREHPFASENDFHLMQRISKGEYKLLQELRPELPTPLVNAIQKALNRNPEDRQTDANQLRHELLATQDAQWHSNGGELLAKLLQELYPLPDDREEAPMEKTPILSKRGSPLPVELAPEESLLISSTDLASHLPTSAVLLRNRVYRPYVISVAVILGGVLGWRGYTLFANSNGAAHSAPSAIPAVVPTLEPTALPTVLPTPSPMAKPLPPIIEPREVLKSARVIKKQKTTPAIPGRLSIVGPNRATVFLNGQKVGVLPRGGNIGDLKPGEYVVSIKPERGSIFNTRVTIKPGETASLNIMSPIR